MSADKLPGIIRYEQDLFQTPNIHEYLGGEVIDVHLANFRDNKQNQELILFYEFEGQLYFPIWFEFRSINNNLLFLFEEYAITDFKTIVRILSSSLEKEEHSLATFKALIYRTKKHPSLSHRLLNFKIDDEDKILIEES